MLVTCDVVVHGQWESPYTGGSVNVVGAWTWFSHGGSIYRKHNENSVAEVWHKQDQSHMYDKKRYYGMLHDSTKTAFHLLLTTTNSPLPSGGPVTTIRFDDKGMTWFATQGGNAASFDGSEWKLYNPKHRDDTYTWPEGTPFAGDTLRHAGSGHKPVSEDLITSTLPPPPSRTYSCGHGLRWPSYALNIHPNGTIYLSTDEGLHVFRVLDEGEQRTSGKTQAAAPYPNPANTTITFALNDNAVNKMTIDIRDLTGRLRLQNIEGVTSGTLVDVTGLEEGVYVALLKSKGATATTTFTVRR